MTRVWLFLRTQWKAILVGALVAGGILGGQAAVAREREYQALKADVSVMKAWILQVQKNATAQAK